MSVISDAFLDNVLQEGMPVVIIPEAFLKKKKKPLRDSLEEGFRRSTNLTKPGSVGVIPSPVPG